MPRPKKPRLYRLKTLDKVHLQNLQAGQYHYVRFYRKKQEIRILHKCKIHGITPERNVQVFYEGYMFTIFRLEDLTKTFRLRYVCD